MNILNANENNQVCVSTYIRNRLQVENKIKTQVWDTVWGRVEDEIVTLTNQVRVNIRNPNFE